MSQYGKIKDFINLLSQKLEKDAHADEGRDRLKLATNLSAAGTALRIAGGKFEELEKLSNRLGIPNPWWPEDFEAHTEMLGDLRYDILEQNFLRPFADGIRKYCCEEEYLPLLEAAAKAIEIAADLIRNAWVISEPRMKENGSC